MPSVWGITPVRIVALAMLCAQVQQPLAREPALVAGVVVDGVTGRPISGALVNLIDRNIPNVFTDALGRFVFTGVPSDKRYTIVASKPGYTIADNESRTLRLTAGQRLSDVRLKLWRLAAISGRVTDHRGDPVVGAAVQSFHAGAIEGSSPVRAAHAQTDDRGAYRLFDLTPGDYFVAASRRGLTPIGDIVSLSAATSVTNNSARAPIINSQALSDRWDGTATVFPPRLYPNAQSFRDATPVHVAPGDDRASVDIVLTPQPVARVSGTIGAEVQISRFELSLVPAAGGQSGDAITDYTAADVAQNAFVFNAVPHGDYVLRVHPMSVNFSSRPTGRVVPDIADKLAYWATISLSITADVSNVAVIVRPGTRLSGEVTFSGNTRPSADTLQKLRVIFMPVSDHTSTAGARLEPDGSFVVREMVPGRYVAQVHTDDAGDLQVKTVMLGGADVTEQPLTIGTEPVTNVQIVISGAADLAALSGVVRSTSGAGADASVFMLPADRKFWQDPRAGGSRFRTIRTGATGTFAFTNVLPGEYLIAATDDPFTASWRSPARLEALARTAERVVIAAGEKRTVTITR